MRVLDNDIIKAALYRKDVFKHCLDVTNLCNEYTDILVDVDGSWLLVDVKLSCDLEQSSNEFLRVLVINKIETLREVLDLNAELLTLLGCNTCELTDVSS